MADVLKVSVEEIANAVSKYNSAQQKMQIACLQMSNTVRSLDTSWDGAASEAFKGQFDAMYKNLEQTQEKIADAVQELEKAAEIYSESEGGLSLKFGQLDTGTTPF